MEGTITGIVVAPGTPDDMFRRMSKVLVGNTDDQMRTYLEQVAHCWLGLVWGAATGRIDVEGTYMHVSHLIVPKDLRGRGYGTAIMRGLCVTADRRGWILTLGPATAYGASAAARLVCWYRRFGFLLNRRLTPVDWNTQAGMVRRPRP